MRPTKLVFELKHSKCMLGPTISRFDCISAFVHRSFVYSKNTSGRSRTSRRPVVDIPRRLKLISYPLAELHCALRNRRFRERTLSRMNSGIQLCRYAYRDTRGSCCQNKRISARVTSGSALLSPREFWSECTSARARLFFIQPWDTREQCLVTLPDLLRRIFFSF